MKNLLMALVVFGSSFAFAETNCDDLNGKYSFQNGKVEFTVKQTGCNSITFDYKDGNNTGTVTYVADGVLRKYSGNSTSYNATSTNLYPNKWVQLMVSVYVQGQTLVMTTNENIGQLDDSKKFLTVTTNRYDETGKLVQTSSILGKRF